MSLNKSNNRKMILIFKILMVSLVVISTIFTSLVESVYAVSGGPNETNTDAGKRNVGRDADYIKARHFINGGGSPYIFRGSKGSWFTCWGYGTQKYKFYKNYHYNPVAGFTSRYGLCENGLKKMEYEAYTNKTSPSEFKRPKLVSGGGVSKGNVIRLNGWAALGGFTHHTMSNQSTYLVAVRLHNGVETSNPEEVFITRAGKGTVGKINATTAFNFNNIPMASKGEYNQNRGLFGKNFRYDDIGFIGAIPVDEMFNDVYKGKTKETKVTYNLYIVKRVEDMIVKAPLTFPDNNVTFDTDNDGYYMGGILELNGARTPNKLYANGDAVMIDGIFGDSMVKGGNNAVLGYNEPVNIVGQDSGIITAYKFRRANGRLGENYSQNFLYNTAGDYNPATVTFTIKIKKKVEVRHLDYDTKKPLYERRGNKLYKANLGNTNKEYPLGAELDFKAYDDSVLLTDEKGNGDYKLFGKPNVKIKISKDDDKNIVTFYYKDVNTFSFKNIDYKYLDKNGKEISQYQFDGDLNEPVKEGYVIDVNTPNTIKKGTSDFDLIGVTTNITKDANGNYIAQKGLNKFVIEYQTFDELIDFVDIPDGDDSDGNPNNPNDNGNPGGDKGNSEIIVEHKDSDTGGKIKPDDRVKVCKDIKYNTVKVGNKEYAPVETEYCDDDTQVVEINYKVVKKKPFGFEEVKNKPTIDLGNMSWRIYKPEKEGLEAKLDLKVDKKDTKFKTNEVDMYIGKGKITDSGLKEKSEDDKDYYYKKLVAKDDSYNEDKKLYKKLTDKYQVRANLKYFNVLKRDLVCSDSSKVNSVWCFKWDISKKEPFTSVIEGEKVDVAEGDINGDETIKKVDAIKGINKILQLDVDTDIGKTVKFNSYDEYESQVLNKDYNIGKTAKVSALETAKGLESNNTIINISKMKDITDEHTEKVTLGKDVIFNKILKTQSSSLFGNEKIEYDNKLDSNKFPLPTKDSEYHIAELDANLEKQLGTADGEKNKIPFKFDEPKMEYKLGKVFDVSKKYGVQVMSDTLNFDERTNLLNAELKSLGLGQDILVDNKLLLAGKTSYYLPVDDEKYKPNTDYVDEVKLKDLGLNDLNYEYTKTYMFLQYLYGNVEDNPVFYQQKDPVKAITYPNSVVIQKEDIQGIRDKIKDRKEHYNLFRVSDDETINSVVNK